MNRYATAKLRNACIDNKLNSEPERNTLTSAITYASLFGNFGKWYPNNQILLQQLESRLTRCKWITEFLAHLFRSLRKTRETKESGEKRTQLFSYRCICSAGLRSGYEISLTQNEVTDPFRNCFIFFTPHDVRKTSYSDPFFRHPLLGGLFI